MSPIYYALGLLLCALTAQAENLTKEHQRILLDLEEAHLIREQAKAHEAEISIEHEQMIGLQERGVITGQELRIARQRYERAVEERQRAELNLQRAFLSSLSDATHLTIVKGQKYGVEDDKVRVRVTLRNDSDLHLAQMVDRARRRYDIKGLDQDAASLLEVDNIFVIFLSNNVMVGQPYEVHIPMLPLGEEVEIEANLQRPELEHLTIQLQYLNRVDDHDIYLEKASAQDIVRVYAMQFSQEGPLGSEVTYDLQLERLAEDEKIFQLMAHGLPKGFRCEFDDATGHHLSQMRFDRGHGSDSLTLRVYIPEQAEDFAVYQPILFSVLAYDPKTVDAEVWASAGPEHFQAMGIGYEQLQLMPTGRAELEFTTLNLDLSVNGEGESKSVWHLHNIGTVELLDIRLQALSPPGWDVAFEPQEVAHIAPREKIEAMLTVRPLDSTEIGRYEVKTSASTHYKGQWVESVERTVNINIESEGSFWGITGLVILLVSIVLGIAVFTVQWSKR